MEEFYVFDANSLAYNNVYTYFCNARHTFKMLQLFCCSHQWLAGYHHLLQHQHWLSCGHADTHHHVYCGGCPLHHCPHKGDIYISASFSKKKLSFFSRSRNEQCVGSWVKRLFKVEMFFLGNINYNGTATVITRLYYFAWLFTYKRIRFFWNLWKMRLSFKPLGGRFTWQWSTDILGPVLLGDLLSTSVVCY